MPGEAACWVVIFLGTRLGEDSWSGIGCAFADARAS